MNFSAPTTVSLNLPAYITETDFFVSSEQSSLVFVHLDERFRVYLRLVSLDEPHKCNLPEILTSVRPLGGCAITLLPQPK